MIMCVIKISFSKDVIMCMMKMICLFTMIMCMMKVIFLLRCDYVHDEGDLFVKM